MGVVTVQANKMLQTTETGETIYKQNQELNLKLETIENRKLKSIKPELKDTEQSIREDENKTVKKK